MCLLHVQVKNRALGEHFFVTLDLAVLGLCSPFNHLVEAVAEHGTRHHLRTLDTGGEVKLDEQRLSVGQDGHVPPHIVEVRQTLVHCYQRVDYPLRRLPCA